MNCPTFHDGFRRSMAIASAMFGMTIAAVAAPPATPSKTLHERHDQVMKMSQIERDHLTRNMAAFEQLSPERQDHYRQLTQQLADDKKSGGQLSTLLQTYSAWLGTLTPGQREQLRLETDSQRKLALVQRFKDEQYRQVESYATNTDSVDDGPRPFGVPKPMSQADLQNVLKVLVADLPENDRQRFSGQLRPEQAVEILRRSIQNAPKGPRSWPSEDLQESLVAALPVQARTLIRRSPVATREKIVGYLFLSLMYQAEELRPRYPGDEDLRRFLDDLEPEVQAELRKHKMEDMKLEVFRRYMDQNDRRLQELRNSLNHLRGEIGLTQSGPRFQVGRPVDRRPDERRQDDRRPEDRRMDERFGPGDRPRPLDRPRPPERDGPERPRREDKEPEPRRPAD